MAAPALRGAAASHGAPAGQPALPQCALRWLHAVSAFAVHSLYGADTVLIPSSSHRCVQPGAGLQAALQAVADRALQVGETAIASYRLHRSSRAENAAILRQAVRDVSMPRVSLARARLPLHALDWLMLCRCAPWRWSRVVRLRTVLTSAACWRRSCWLPHTCAAARCWPLWARQLRVGRPLLTPWHAAYGMQYSPFAYQPVVAEDSELGARHADKPGRESLAARPGCGSGAAGAGRGR